MSEQPTNEPMAEKETGLPEQIDSQSQAMTESTEINSDSTPQETAVTEEKRPSRRWLWVTIVIVVVIGLLAAGGVISTQNKEKSEWADAQAAAVAGDWALVEQTTDDLLAIEPAFLQQHSADALGLRGVARFQQGNSEAALTDLNEALTQTDNLVDLRAYRAMILAETDNEAAQVDAQTAVDSGLLSEYLHAQMLVILARGSDLASLEKALATPEYLSDDQLADLYLVRLDGHLQNEETAEALALVQAAQSQDIAFSAEQQAKLALTAAEIYEQQGDLAAAFAQTTTALDLTDALAEADLVTLYLIRAGWFLETGEWDTAVVEAEKAGELDETLALPHAMQAWQAYQTFDFETAVASAEMALAQATADDLATQIAQRSLGGVATWQGTPNVAIESLDAALAIDPDDIEARALRAYNLLEVTDAAGVEADVQHLLDIAPEAPVSLWAQALLAMWDGERELANVLLSQAIAQDESRPEYFVARAFSYRRSADLEKALSDVETALSLYPDFGPAIATRQYWYLDQYDHSQQEETATKLIEMFPDWSAGYGLLAEYQLSVVGDYDEALRLSEKAIELNPQSAEGYIWRARINCFRGELEAARTDYEYILSLDPTSYSARNGLASLAANEGDLETVAALYQENAAAYPHSLSALLDLGWVYLDQDRVEESWQIVHEVLARDSRYEEALVLKSYLLLYQGDLDQALQEIEIVTRMHPNYAFAHNLKASILFDMGDLDAATESAEQAAVLDPFALDPHRLLFWVALEQGDIDEATAQIDLWLEKMRLVDEDRELLSYMQLAAGRAEDAINTASEGILAEPDVASYYYNRGLAYLNSEQVEEGQADLMQVLKLAENINLIADTENILVESSQLVKTDDGRLQYTNEDFGYTMTYADFWLNQPPDPTSNYDILLIYEDDSGFGVVQTVLFFFEDFGSASEVVDLIIQEAQGVTFTVIGREAVDFGNGDAHMLRYELDLDELYQGKQYIFFEDGRIIIMTLEALDETFPELEAEFDEIAASFSYLP